jgi:hypothetical protein
MSRKKKSKAIISIFKTLPCDLIRTILTYDPRFYYTREGTLISRFHPEDYRYTLLSKIPKISYIWNYYYIYGNMVSYIVSMVFLSKNKKQRFSLGYHLEDTNIEEIELDSNIQYARKVVFRNHYTYEDTLCLI